MRRAGATGATVLAGVDGVLGRRRRERLFRNGGAPMVVVSVGPAEVLEPLRASLPHAWLQPVALLKHAGEQLAPLPSADGWQAIRVYSRRTHPAGGGALTRRLRQVDAAGATTLLGEWGFTGGERPFGDRLGRIASHRPTCTVYIDRAERVAEHWPIIDELTAEHGTVTAVPVPVYDRWPQVRLQPVELERAEGVEALVLGAVEVGRAGGQQAALRSPPRAARASAPRRGWRRRPRRRRARRRRTRRAWRAPRRSRSRSQNGCAQTATPPAAWITSIACATVGRLRAT